MATSHNEIHLRIMARAIADPRYMTGVDSEELTRNVLEDRIAQLFKKVWLGLYEIDDLETRSQLNRLRALYHGAGFDDVHPLFFLFRRQFQGMFHEGRRFNENLRPYIDRKIGVYNRDLSGL